MINVIFFPSLSDKVDKREVVVWSQPEARWERRGGARDLSWGPPRADLLLRAGSGPAPSPCFPARVSRSNHNPSRGPDAANVEINAAWLS